MVMVVVVNDGGFVAMIAVVPGKIANLVWLLFSGADADKYH